MLAAAGLSTGISTFAGIAKKNSYDGLVGRAQDHDDDAFKISILSKHLQWLGYAEMAQVAAGMGFDGVDITVRPDGHVRPVKVSVDLPKAVEAVRKTGMNVYMITTAIQDADEPNTESILKTASELGIRHYRMGWYHYNDGMSVDDNLVAIEGKLQKIATLNKKYDIVGEYQNHSGTYFGAPIWDLYTVLNRMNTPWIGSQYDIMHATVEGSNTWPIGLKLIKQFIKSIDVKDFQWAKEDGKWAAEIIPLGEGLVDYKSYFSLLKKYAISVPVSMHFEYPLGGAEHGLDSLTIESDEVISAMTRDLQLLRKMFREAGI